MRHQPERSEGHRGDATHNTNHTSRAHLWGVLVLHLRKVDTLRAIPVGLESASLWRDSWLTGRPYWRFAVQLRGVVVVRP